MACRLKNSCAESTLLVAAGDQYRLYSANLDGTPGVGIFRQALTSSGASAIRMNSTITASGTEVLLHDALGRLRNFTNCNGSSGAFNFDAAGYPTTVSTTSP